MGLYYLNYTNYFVSAENGKLCNDIKGFSFVLFTSANCEYCDIVIPIFDKLSTVVQGCIFGKFNIKNHREAILHMAAKSKTPIDYVPYLVLYFNGTPIAIFSYNNEISSQNNFINMKNFIITHTKTPTSINTNKPSSNIPGFTIGKPICSSGVCYTNFNSAYKTK